MPSSRHRYSFSALMKKKISTKKPKALPMARKKKKSKKEEPLRGARFLAGY